VGGEVPGGLAWVTTISLYDLSVLTFLPTMRAVSGFLDRAAKHCAETGADPDDFVRARLYSDMAPLHFQIEALLSRNRSNDQRHCGARSRERWDSGSCGAGYRIWPTTESNRLSG
jgi:hypothetical protein